MSPSDNPSEAQSIAEHLSEDADEARAHVRSWIHRTIWQRVPEKYRQNVQPEILELNLLPGEEVQLEIRMAWYRDMLSHVIFGHFIWALLLTLIFATILFFTTRNAILLLIPLGLLLLAIAEASREFIEYNQWRLIKTNKRLIISLPQQGAWPLVDNIEMGDFPKVIDTNWSANAVWRVFQFFTGSRDVYISLTAFKFEQGTARVKDALVIPDVMPDDVFRLKELVFNRH